MRRPHSLFDDVRHPYTQALFSAVLLARPDQLEEEIVLAGEIPSPAQSAQRLPVPYALPLGQCRAAPARSLRCGRYRLATAWRATCTRLATSVSVAGARSAVTSG